MHKPHLRHAQLFTTPQSISYDNQKKCVPYLTQAAMVHPEAMIRMGEVYEQGFYDVKPDKKRLVMLLLLLMLLMFPHL